MRHNKYLFLKQPFLLAALLSLAGPPMHSRADITVRGEPHYFDGPRGSEPRFQGVLELDASLRSEPESAFPWEFRSHYQTETLGRRDFSLDLDRAWIATPLATPFGKSQFYWGRIHPWDISGNPEASRGWGYLAQSQSLNRGVLLGRREPEGVFPEPILMGWVGAHFWSETDSKGGSPLQFGFSASPMFVPSLGSEVKLSESEDTQTGRFGRRPPGFVELNGARFPLRYRIDGSRIIEDVVLQPQLAAQVRWKSPKAFYETWLFAGRAPEPDPVPETTGVLRVRPSGVDAVALVVPKFPQRWLGSMNQRVNITESLYLVNSLFAKQGGIWGYELGAGSKHLKFSFLDELNPEGSQDLDSADVPYADRLIQAEGQIWFLGARWYGGIKRHLSQEASAWVRSGVVVPVAANGNAGLGFDLFGGATGTYFGEWRTNDRVFLTLDWRFGS